MKITNVEVQAGKGLFKAQGKILKFDGYRRVSPPVGKQEDALLPALDEKQAMDLLDPGFRESFRLEVGKRLHQRTDLLGPGRGEVLLQLATGLPESPAESGMLLTLYDARSGMPVAIVDAAELTSMRTGALTALGARHLARPGARVLGHVGARGTAYWNVRLLDRLFDFDEIRVHSRRPESRDAFARRLEDDLGKPVRRADTWADCLRGADVMVEASRLERPEPHLLTSWVEPGCLVIPYGTMSAVELTLTDVMDKVVVDDWGQARAGSFGALRAHVDSGRLSEESLHAELCQIVVGDRPGRESDDERILFWHRGLSLSDIALGHALLEKARGLGVGQILDVA